MSNYGVPNYCPKPYPLSCGHVIWLFPAPAKFDSLFCFRCDTYVYRAGVNPEYRYYCDTCNQGRKYGQGRLNSEMGASKHFRKNPSHMVKLFYGSELRHTITNITIPIPNDNEVPF